MLEQTRRKSKLKILKPHHSLKPVKSRGVDKEGEGVPSRPFREEPETFVSILKIQHYTYAPGAFCYALSTAGTSTATAGSGVFNLLKFDHISKKERKKEREQVCMKFPSPIRLCKIFASADNPHNIVTSQQVSIKFFVCVLIRLWPTLPSLSPAFPPILISAPSFTAPQYPPSP